MEYLSIFQGRYYLEFERHEKLHYLFPHIYLCCTS